ncbi:hypothetical protein SAMN02745119_00217 [Trichlorobacter thiogenes]|uniref:Uncharacterized protein n=1 Tax=Trichlorobacter thiogenes TaxID=115783 RepID=A0A1T4K076_9BACT|nr:hypothetical protein [Trichlorobacter thiogenes]SJZ35717.1 hypothetical protein SAMN02745119_00217 [Trichlorobacter thiogenes]
MNLIIDENWSLNDAEWHLRHLEAQFNNQQKTVSDHIEKLKAFVDRKRAESIERMKAI